MITYFEKKAVLSNADQLAENFVAYNESLSPVVLKLLINSLRKIPATIPLNINEINEKDLADPSVVKSIYTEIIKYMATVSVDEQQGEIIYKTGDLGRIMKEHLTSSKLIKFWKEAKQIFRMNYLVR